MFALIDFSNSLKKYWSIERPKRNIDGIWSSVHFISLTCIWNYLKCILRTRLGLSLTQRRYIGQVPVGFNVNIDVLGFYRTGQLWQWECQENQFHFIDVLDEQLLIVQPFRFAHRQLHTNRYANQTALDAGTWLWWHFGSAAYHYWGKRYENSLLKKNKIPSYLPHPDKNSRFLPFFIWHLSRWKVQRPIDKKRTEVI